MPVTKSAKKSLRRDKRRKIRNLARKKTVKNILKEADRLIAEGKKEKAKEFLPKVYKAIDKAVKKGIIKKNTASRKKAKASMAVSKPRQ